MLEVLLGPMPPKLLGLAKLLRVERRLEPAAVALLLSGKLKRALRTQTLALHLPLLLRRVRTHPMLGHSSDQSVARAAGCCSGPSSRRATSSQSLESFARRLPRRTALFAPLSVELPVATRGVLAGDDVGAG